MYWPDLSAVIVMARYYPPGRATHLTPPGRYDASTLWVRPAGPKDSAWESCFSGHLAAAASWLPSAIARAAVARHVSAQHVPTGRHLAPEVPGTVRIA